MKHLELKAVANATYPHKVQKNFTYLSREQRRENINR